MPDSLNQSAPNAPNAPTFPFQRTCPFDPPPEYAKARAAGPILPVLRYVSPVQFSPRRVAREDVEIGGVKITKGDGLFMLLGSANRDETMFECPDIVDPHRDASRHLAFGYGIHQCLGQMLARFELQIMYAAILRRLPDLRLAVPLEAIRFKHDMQIYGVHNLPVTW